MSIEDLAIRTITEYGTRAGYGEINWVLNEHGFQDPDGQLANRIIELMKTATIKVKVRYV